MLRALFLSFLVLTPIGAQEYDFLTQRLIDHVNALNAFALEYRGCSQRPITNTSGIPQNCENAGSFDMKKFNKAKQTAEKLFDLVPRP